MACFKANKLPVKNTKITASLQMLDLQQPANISGFTEHFFCNVAQAVHLR